MTAESFGRHEKALAHATLPHSWPPVPTGFDVGVGGVRGGGIGIGIVVKSSADGLAGGSVAVVGEESREEGGEEAGEEASLSLGEEVNVMTTTTTTAAAGKA